MANPDRRLRFGPLSQQFVYDDKGYACYSARVEAAADLCGLVHALHQERAIHQIDVRFFHWRTANRLIGRGSVDNGEERNIKDASIWRSPAYPTCRTARRRDRGFSQWSP
jgi:hypothetical protein